MIKGDECKINAEFRLSPLAFSAVYGRICTMGNDRNPDLLLIPAFSPDSVEFLAILEDLFDYCGSWDAVCVAAGVPHGSLSTWRFGNATPSALMRRHVWLVWALICRPGQVATVFDLATCGRYTDSAGPQHCGRAMRNGRRPKRTRPKVKISFTGPPEHPPKS